MELQNKFAARREKGRSITTNKKESKKRKESSTFWALKSVTGLRCFLGEGGKKTWLKRPAEKRGGKKKKARIDSGFI